MKIAAKTGVSHDTRTTLIKVSQDNPAGKISSILYIRRSFGSLKSLAEPIFV